MHGQTHNEFITKHVAFTDEFNKRLLCLTAIQIQIIIIILITSPFSKYKSKSYIF